MPLKLKNEQLIKIILIITIIIFLGLGVWALVSLRTFQFFGGLTSRVNTNQKVVALTLDDGPEPGHTEYVLKVLKEKNVKATFMLIGTEIAKHPEQARLIAMDGHQIGNHSYSHNSMVLVNPAKYKNEVERTDNLIKRLGYEDEIVFRPPYGHKLISSPYYLAKNNKKTIMWDVEPERNKSVIHSSAAITNDVIKNTRPGSIIILHVMYDHRKITRDALSPIIDGLKNNGYKFVTINELLKYDKQ